MEELGLISLGDGRYVRHPLTYLVEAADDICYTLIDFEDGINLGLIQEERLEYLVNLVKNTLQKDKFNKLENRQIDWPIYVHWPSEPLFKRRGTFP